MPASQHQSPKSDIEIAQASKPRRILDVAKDKLGIALKGASEPVRQFFLSNMSSRAAKMLVYDMQAMGPVRLRDVDDAQVTQLVHYLRDRFAPDQPRWHGVEETVAKIRKQSTH